MDIRAHNRRAWNQEVENGNEWTVPVGPEVIAKARKGEWRIYLTPNKPVPPEWWPPLQGTKVLCLASGGGQQGPILAAAGAIVTVYDNSPKQLGQDRMVAEREGLELEMVEGDMADLKHFHDESFDLVVNPCSTCFAEKVLPVWRETFRVLKHGGVFLTGVMNPAVYLFEDELMEKTGELRVVHALPYSDVTHLPADKLKKLVDTNDMLEYSHSLTELIGGQIDAGFILTGLFEDTYRDDHHDPVSRYLPICIDTRAVKP
jgi:SAM-dependent methyltransferase